MEQEYFTTVRAEVYITLRSEHPITEQDVHQVLAETHYEFGTDEGIDVAPEDSNDPNVVCVSGTCWEENEITSLNMTEE